MEPKTNESLTVDVELLKEQAAIIGTIVDKNFCSEEDAPKLTGVWELLHSILDGLENGTVFITKKK